MNKVIIFISILISIVFINLGFSYQKQAADFSEQRDQVAKENATFIQEITQKQQYSKRPPLGMNDAFNFFINLKRMLENYGGTKMEFLFTPKNGHDSLQDYYMDSNFKNVKELPITLKITKLSKDTDNVSVLRDIYMLEKETDFKIDQITGENDVFEVKGELYGI